MALKRCAGQAPVTSCHFKHSLLPQETQQDTVIRSPYIGSFSSPQTRHVLPFVIGRTVVLFFNNETDTMRGDMVWLVIAPMETVVIGQRCSPRLANAKSLRTRL